MNVDHLHPFSGTIEEVTGISSGVETWGNQQTINYAISDNVVLKDKWQREERDVFTKMSINLQLDPEKKYRVWKQGRDTSDSDAANPVDIVRPVYDIKGNFIHTVVEL